MQLVRVKCDRCSSERHYRPADLIKIFGDADVNRLAWKMKCERCGSGEQIDAQVTLPVAAQRAGIKVRRLVEIKTQTIPVWEDER